MQAHVHVQIQMQLQVQSWYRRTKRWRRKQNKKNTLPFLVNCIFQSIAMKMVVQSFLCTGCMCLGFVTVSCTICISWAPWIWNLFQIKEVWEQLNRRWVGTSSVWQPNGHLASEMTPLLADLSLVLRRLCGASHAKILHFLGAKDFQISLLPKQAEPP